MKSYKTEIPANSLLKQYFPVDYADAFACDVETEKTLQADEIMIDLWTVMPRWLNALFKLRNILVRPFGLATGRNEDHAVNLNTMIRNGSGNAGIMSVAGKTENETAILLSDKHLDAYMSVFIDQQTVTATTLVCYHNILGRVYFFFIRPFHAIVVKAMLKGTLKRMVR
jgi:hypothetical protein